MPQVLLTRMLQGRRPLQFLILAATVVFFYITLRKKVALVSTWRDGFNDYKHKQPLRPERFEPNWTIPLPRGRPARIPRIQYEFSTETPIVKAEREKRASAVRDAFVHAYHGYKTHSWAEDELAPLTGGSKSPFCGWAATLVDSLDTMHIMGLHEEFREAVEEVGKIDFTGTEGCMINLFEMTIRHLGGLLSAYDVSGGKYDILLNKSVELGEILYTAFDTPNRMPSPHYVWSATNENANTHRPSNSVVLAVLGTLQLEFTRLSQLTGNEKYYSAVQHVVDELEKWQNATSLPGMWPATVDSTLVDQQVSVGSPYPNAVEQFTLGALADSTYEYLPKQYLLLGGLSQQGRRLYENFVETAKKYLFYRPMTLNEEDILLSGTVKKAMGAEGYLETEAQHLTCFVGGMLAIAGKIFKRQEDVEDGSKLAAGCVWAYRSTTTGIMPETFRTVACTQRSNCPWNETEWWQAIMPQGTPEDLRMTINRERLPPGFTHIQDKRYLLRPEAIESVFILYRITGDEFWYQAGWDMFKAIQAYTKSSLANSAIDDVTSFSPAKVDEMESFWLAETLKYFYLLFSEPNVISLDEYVLNTEAHPLKLPRR